MSSRRRIAVVLSIPLLAALGGCGARRPGAGPLAGARPTDVYRQLGLLAGGGDFPAVASFATLAGPGDSTYVAFGLSLPNSALRFQRDGAGFTAQYTVALTFTRDSQRVRRVERREDVRVRNFAETARTDESVVFQQLVALRPGRYVVDLVAADANSTRVFRARDTIELPAYGQGARRLSEPVVVYRAGARDSRDTIPALILNPRHMTPYGGQAPRVYLEGYGVAADSAVALRVLDAHGTTVWTTTVPLVAGSATLRHALVQLPADSLPLGKLWVDLDGRRAPLLVSISDQWMVANVDEVLQYVRYIASAEEVDSLRAAPPAERKQRWEAFWARRDPLPATPANEFRDEFFERIRTATEQFSEPGIPGWRSARGEVYIVLGAPDRVVERTIGRNDLGGTLPAALEWTYEDSPAGRLELTFVDRTGAGRYELTAPSASAFRAVEHRLQSRR
ncbi:MAG: GWxTD domain-containing protein [Gemmatimonadetes bacterium]|nr:GWxTD domain-containing protein [Gemmatimonadota bacterium]